MTILTSFTLVVLIIVAAIFIAYNVQKGTKTLEELRANYYDNEEIQEVAELAQELQNKDLRPTVAKKAPKKEVTSEDITPQVIDKAVETIDAVEVLSNLLQDEVKKIPQEVPAKPKKKKFYPKSPKGKA
jgi:hypothetical protein